MASKRGQVAMSEEEVLAFLDDHVKVQVATLGADGAPHLTTLFYVVDDGRVTFWTYGASQKVVNLRRDPRITVLVEDGEAYDELRGVSIRGTARLVEDYDAVRRVGDLVALAMARGTGVTDELRELSDAVVAQQAHKRVAVVVEPDRVLSWDHRRLRLG